MTCRAGRRGAPVKVQWLEEPAACTDGACRAVTVRAYHGLRDRGVSDRAAFEASVTLFRLRHKERTARDAILQVAEWISDDLDCEPDGPPAAGPSPR